MPLVIAQFLRVVIMALVTGAAVTAANAFFESAIYKVIDFLKKTYGYTDEDATIVTANTILSLALNTITIFALLKTKMPVKVAEKLGFSSKGYVFQSLSPAGKKIEAAAKADKITKYSLFGKMGAALAVSFAAAIPWLPNLVQQTLDQGTFNPTNANRALEALKIPFRWPTSDKLSSPPPFKAQEFSDYAEGLERTGIVGMNDECKAQSVPYSRTALAELIFCIYGTAASKGISLSVAKIIPEIAKSLVFKGGARPPEATRVPAFAEAAPSRQIKVFTGILSQGVLGRGLSFTPRENDLIESVEELRQSAQNNLAPFLASLPSRVVYELKVVSSITTKDGFRQVGTAQRIISGYTKDGRPKYKNVVNKFAVMDIYVLTDRKVRTKLTQVVLGPVDSAQLQVTPQDLRELETTVSQDILTSNIEEISGVQGAEPIPQVVPETPVYAEVPPAPVPLGPKRTAKIDDSFFIHADGFAGYIWKIKNNRVYEIIPSDFLFTPEERVKLGNFTAQFNAAIPKLKEMGINPGSMRRVRFFDLEPGGREPFLTEPFDIFFNISEEPITKPPGGELPQAALDAQTLYEFYTALGLPVPSIEARSQIYAGFSLGPANYYTGTAEQNTRLLRKLQGKEI